MIPYAWTLSVCARLSFVPWANSAPFIAYESCPWTYFIGLSFVASAFFLAHQANFWLQSSISMIYRMNLNLFFLSKFTDSHSWVFIQVYELVFQSCPLSTVLLTSSHPNANTWFRSWFHNQKRADYVAGMKIGVGFKVDAGSSPPLSGVLADWLDVEEGEAVSGSVEFGPLGWWSCHFEVYCLGLGGNLSVKN